MNCQKYKFWLSSGKSPLFPVGPWQQRPTPRTRSSCRQCGCHGDGGSETSRHGQRPPSSPKEGQGRPPAGVWGMRRAGWGRRSRVSPHRRSLRVCMSGCRAASSTALRRAALGGHRHAPALSAVPALAAGRWGRSWPSEGSTCAADPSEVRPLWDRAPPSASGSPTLCPPLAAAAPPPLARPAFSCVCPLCPPRPVAPPPTQRRGSSLAPPADERRRVCSGVQRCSRSQLEAAPGPHPGHLSHPLCLSSPFPQDPNQNDAIYAT